MLDRITDPNIKSKLKKVFEKDQKWQFFYEEGLKEIDSGNRVIISANKRPLNVYDHLDWDKPVECNTSADEWARYIVQIEFDGPRKNLPPADTLCRILSGPKGEAVFDHDSIELYEKFSKICNERDPDKHPDNHCVLIKSPSGKYHHHFIYKNLEGQEWIRFPLAKKKDKDGTIKSMGELKYNGFITIARWDEESKTNKMTVMKGDRFNVPEVSKELICYWLDIYKEISPVEINESKNPTPKIPSISWNDIYGDSKKSESKDLNREETYIKLVAAKFNERNSAVDIAGSIGCEIYSDRFKRPNKDSEGISGYISDKVLVNFSTNFPYAGSASAKSAANGMGEVFSAFGLHAAIHHGGDEFAAANAVCEQIDVPKFKEWGVERVVESKRSTEDDIREVMREAAKIKEDRKQDISETWDILPQKVKDLAVAIAAHNPMANTQTSMMHAMAIAGGIIGKRVKAHNMSRDYYASEWLIVMQSTGSNKSAINKVEGILNAIATCEFSKAEAEQKKPQSWKDLSIVHGSPFRTLSSTWTLAGLYLTMGENISNKDLKNWSEAEVQSEKTALIDGMKRSCGRISFVEEAAYTLDAAISAAGPNKTGEIKNFLKLADNDGFLEQTTKTDGERFIYYPCVCMIGITQPSAWYRYFDEKEYKEAGLIGRFSPFLPEFYKDNLFEKVSGSHEETERMLIDALRSLTDSVQYLGWRELGFSDGIDQYVNEALALVEKDPAVVQLKKYHFDEWDTFSSKMIISAVRRCIMHATYEDPENFERPSHEIFAKYYLLAVKQWLTYVLAEEPNSESDQAIMKIYKHLMYKRDSKDKPEWVTTRDIQRLGIKTYKAPLTIEGVRVLLETMVEKGIVDVKKKPIGIHDTIVAARWSGKELNLSALR